MVTDPGRSALIVAFADSCDAFGSGGRYQARDGLVIGLQVALPEKMTRLRVLSMASSAPVPEENNSLVPVPEARVPGRQRHGTAPDVVRRPSSLRRAADAVPVLHGVLYLPRNQILNFARLPRRSRADGPKRHHTEASSRT
jgi:hypothetical protein